MMLNYKKNCKTVEEAKSTLLSEHNANESDVIFTKVEEGKNGFLGFGSKKAEVHMIIKKDIVLEGKNFLTKLLNNLEFEPKIEAYIKNDIIVYKINTNNNAILIGKGGSNLKSLDFFIRQLLDKYLEYVKVSIDIAGYKENRDSKLKELANSLARKVIISKQDYQMKPMNSYERRVTHSTLMKYKEIYTKSYGKEPERYIIIKYKKN